MWDSGIVRAGSYCFYPYEGDVWKCQDTQVQEVTSCWVEFPLQVAEIPLIAKRDYFSKYLVTIIMVGEC